MIFLTALTALVAILGISVLSGVLGNMSPNRKRLEAEIKNLKLDMDKWAGELIPLDKEELELFSLTQDKQVLKKGWSTSAKGVFTTIYHEPVMAYNYKKYLGGTATTNALLYVRTSTNEFAYWLQKGGIQLIIDDQIVGEIRDGALYGKKTKQVLAKVKQSQQELLPIQVYDKEVGSVTKALPPANKDLSPRAFEFVKEGMSKEEELLFLSLATLELVKKTVTK
ncbi:MAG: hypothetical protein DHS20C18_08540 [Saprospiraceae bacterium]|nr:MAG: hypothetical protein DHS20C18_08540 [Saprospiraceae bacterium]